MSELLTTCPECRKVHSEDVNVTVCHCPYCNAKYKAWDDQPDDDDPDPDFGGVHDGVGGIHSDADPGL